METNITKEVIFSYFAGTCTTLQKNLIEEWAKEPINRELFYTWLCEWEKSNIQYHVDLEAGINRHRAWLQGLENKNVVDVLEPSHLPYTFPWRKLAVACLLLISLILSWISKDVIIYNTYETTYGEIKKITLADGSKIVLNANSILTVPRFGFGKNTRNVFLEGEANFDVVHTIDHLRFIVKTKGKMNVEVLGTEFNVYSRESGSRVVLNTGQIQLYYDDGEKQKKLTMKPGDLATMDPKGKVVMTHTPHPQNFSAWKYHRFIFEDQAFGEICNRLEETFGNKIIIEDTTLSEQIISGTFTALDAEELLDILSLAGKFKYKKNDNQIVISEDSE